jgi:hypothetical protein
MMRMIVGFDPSKAQAAIAELRNELAPGVQWRVLNLDQNPHGVEPARPQDKREHHGFAAGLFHSLAAWLGKGSGRASRRKNGSRLTANCLRTSLSNSAPKSWPICVTLPRAGTRRYGASGDRTTMSMRRQCACGQCATAALTSLPWRWRSTCAGSIWLKPRLIDKLG